MSSSKTAATKTQSRAGAASRGGAKASRPVRAPAVHAASAQKTAGKRKPAPSGNGAAPTPNLGPQMAEMAVAIEKALRADDLAALPPETLQQLIAAVTKAYRVKVEAGEQFHPASRAGRLTPTDIMVMANGLLRSGNLQIFELGMWQSWTGH